MLCVEGASLGRTVANEGAFLLSVQAFDGGIEIEDPGSAGDGGQPELAYILVRSVPRKTT